MTVFKPPEQKNIYILSNSRPWFRQTKTCVGVCHENHADFELKTGTEHYFLSWSFFTTKYQRQNEPSFREGETFRRNLIRFTTKTIDQLFQLLLVTPMGRTGAASLDVSPFCKGLWSYHRRICILKPITGFQLTVDLSTTPHRSQFLINSRHFRFSPTSYICHAAAHVQLISKQTAISWFCHPFVMRRC